MMEKAIIVLNGSINYKHPFYRKFRQQSALVVCADGGVRNAELLGLVPDVVVGDMDSITDRQKERYEDVLVEDFDQNTTDCEKALEYCRSIGAKEIEILGANGSRWDHFIATALLLKEYSDLKVRVVDENNEMFLADKGLKMREPEGTLVSLLPIEKVEGLRLEGFRYNVENGVLENASRGIHNIIMKRPANLSFDAGELLVVISRSQG